MHEVHGRQTRSRATSEARCAACAEALAPGARVCGSCGERREAWRPRRFAAPERAVKSPGLAAALAAIFPGAGHLYCERIAAGLLIIFVLPVALSLTALTTLTLGVRVGGLAGASGAYVAILAVAFGVYGWQILDAYSSARPATPLRPRRRRQPRRTARARSAHASGGSPGAAAPR